MKDSIFGEDCGAYEIFLPDDFDAQKFVRAAKNGSGDFWLVCFDDEEGILRFKGVYRKTGDRCILDILPDEKVAYTPHKESYALEIARSLKATTVYKDGAELTNYKK